MKRREFFKSSALWLAGLLVAPHLKFAPIGRRSIVMMSDLHISKFPPLLPSPPFPMISISKAYEMFAEAIRKSVDEFDEQERCQAVLNYVLSENYVR